MAVITDPDLLLKDASIVARFGVYLFFRLRRVVEFQCYAPHAIQQEVLSGYSDLNKFETLKAKLNYFENTPILDEDYITTAKFYNECRQKGVQGSHIDLLICAVAVRLNVQIFTSDKDFGFYQQYLPINLYSTTTA